MPLTGMYHPSVFTLLPKEEKKKKKTEELWEVTYFIEGTGKEYVTVSLKNHRTVE